MKLILALALCLIGCGRSPADLPPPPDPVVWPADRDCDGLLWAGLAAAAGDPVTLTAARDSDGGWHRRPLSYGECYPHEAPSTISRDMFVGLLAGLQAQGDLAAIEATLQYATANAGVMGAPWPGDGRTTWTPNMFGLYARAARALGSERWAIPAAIPLVLSRGADYALHLSLIEMAIETRSAGKLPAHLIPSAIYTAALNPHDGLAQAIGCLALVATNCNNASALLAPGAAYLSPTYVRGPVAAPEIHLSYARAVLGLSRGQ